MKTLKEIIQEYIFLSDTGDEMCSNKKYLQSDLEKLIEEAYLSGGEDKSKNTVSYLFRAEKQLTDEQLWQQNKERFLG